MRPSRRLPWFVVIHALASNPGLRHRFPQGVGRDVETALMSVLYRFGDDGLPTFVLPDLNLPG